MKRTRIEFSCDDGMAAHVYDCFSARVTDVAIFPNSQNYQQTTNQPDGSIRTEAIELELQLTSAIT